MIQMDEGRRDSIINNRAVFPNQNGDFCKLTSLQKDGGYIDEEFKDILHLFGQDLRKDLADKGIRFEIAAEKVWDRKYAVSQISTLADNKSIDREVAKDFRDAFERLLKRFRANPDSAQSSFPSLYRRRHVLYDEDSIIENLDKAEQLDVFPNEAGVVNIEGLRRFVQKGQITSTQILPITQDILASLGITSLEDWKNAIQDKDLACMFAHESIPTSEMFIYAHDLISRAKTAILAHLKTQSE